jgi:hypothetical protein
MKTVRPKGERLFAISFFKLFRGVYPNETIKTSRLFCICITAWVLLLELSASFLILPDFPVRYDLLIGSPG